MIDAAKIAEIIATYQKHGWVIRRILLTKETRGKLNKYENAFFLQGVTVLESEIDAAWFSRPPAPGGVSWELRYLGDLPYALVEKIDENDSNFEENLLGVQERLIDTIAARTSLDNNSN